MEEKILITASTRPEIIKLFPVIRELEKRKIDYCFAATGQHYSRALYDVFFEELGIRKPEYNAEIGSGSHAEQTARALLALEKIIKHAKPFLVVTQGDTNSTLSSALAAVKLGIPCAHVEAGLRSFDMRMPEEVNRILADHCSQLLFAPTEISADNLLREGIEKEKIFITGNTIVDAISYCIKLAERKAEINFDIPDEFALMTLHRQENVDERERLKEILSGVSHSHIPVLFPVHPRTEKKIKEFSLKNFFKNSSIKLLEPLSYFSFLFLLKRVSFVLTDSGGVQEEAATLKIPCITLRYNTERVETLISGINILAPEKNDIIKALRIIRSREMIEKVKHAKNPFGDGNAGKRIVEIICREKEEGRIKIESSDMRMQYAIG